MKISFIFIFYLITVSNTASKLRKLETTLAEGFSPTNFINIPDNTGFAVIGYTWPNYCLNYYKLGITLSSPLTTTDVKSSRDPRGIFLSSGDFVTCDTYLSVLTCLFINSTSHYIIKTLNVNLSPKSVNSYQACLAKLSDSFAVGWAETTHIGFAIISNSSREAISVYQSATDNFTYREPIAINCEGFPTGDNFIFAYTKTGYRIYAKVFNKNMLEVCSEFEVSPSDVNAQQMMIIKAITSSLFVICFRQHKTDVNSDSRIQCKTYTFSGSSCSAGYGPYNVSSSYITNNYLYSVITFSETSFIVGFYNAVTLWAQRMDVSGVTIDSAVALSYTGMSNPSIGFWNGNLYFSYVVIGSTTTSYYGYKSYAPVCSSFSLSVSAKSTTNIDFSTKISYSISANLRVYFNALPTDGTIYLRTDENQVSITLNTQYQLTDLAYTSGGTTASYTATFKGIDTVLTFESSVCTLTINNSCYTSCSTCTAMGESTNHYCDQCTSGYYHKVDELTQCYNTLPSQYYYDSTNKIYQKCYTDCLTCSGSGDASASNCTSCNSPLYYYASTHNCYAVCPIGAYRTSSTACDTCISQGSNYTYKEDVANYCLLNTANPAKYYLDTATIPNVYRKCHVACGTCAGPGTDANTNCETCATGYFFVIGTTLMCLSQKDGYYPDAAAGVLKPCSASCATCNQAGTVLQSNCSSCPATFYLHTDTNCYTQCPVNYYGRTDLPICSACFTNCQKCSTSTTCESCAPGYYLSVSALACIPTCPTGTYVNTTTNACTLCVAPCVNCTSEAECLSCTTGLYLFNGKCVSECESGSTVMSGSCVTCASLDKFFYLGKCLVSCPNGTYTDINYCFTCKAPCVNCTSETECLSCTSGLYLFNGKCVSSCEIGYAITSGACVNCASLDKFFYLGKCLVSCPNGTYTDTNYCFTCKAPCVNCTSETECLSCTTGLYLFNGKCVSSCEIGYAITSGACVNCASLDKYFYLGKCLNVCPNDTIIDETGSLCIRCADTGKIVYEGQCVEICPEFYENIKGVCYQCSVIQLYYNHQCLNSCPLGYSPNDRRCVVDPLGKDINATISGSSFATTESLCDPNPCNGHPCKTQFNEAVCECPPNLFGQFCSFADTQLPQITKNMENLITRITDIPNEPLTQNTINKLIECNRLIEQVPSMITPELTIGLYQIASNQLDYQLKSTNGTDPQVLKIVDLAINAQLKNAEKDSVYTATSNIKMNALVNKVGSIVEMITNTTDFTNGSTLILGGKNIGIQIGIPNENSTAIAKQNRLSVVNVDQLKSQFERPILMSTMEISPSVAGGGEYAQRKIVFRLYDPETKQPLDMKQAENTTIPIIFPLEHTDKLNLSVYHNLSSSDIDIFNSNSPAFNERCFTIIDKNTEFDTTVQSRRNNYYQNISAGCGDGCSYEGIDNDNYMACKCKATTQEVQGDFIEQLLGKFPTFNFEIIYCTNKVFDRKVISQNLGLIFILVLLAVYVIIFLLLHFTSKTLITQENIHSILYYDGEFFTGKDIEPKEYFKSKKEQNEVIELQKMKTQDPGTKAALESESPNEKEVQVEVNANPGMFIKINILEESQEPQGTSPEKNDRALYGLDARAQEEDPDEKEEKIFQMFYNDPQRKPCFADYESLEPEDMIKYDKRGFCQYIIDYLMVEHSLLSLFKKSLLSPFYIRITKFFCSISMSFAINAILYSDDYIERKSEAEPESRVSSRI